MRSGKGFLMKHGLAGGRYRPLTQDQVGRIHAGALRILESIGVRVEMPEAVEVFQDAGAVVDTAERRASQHPEWRAYPTQIRGGNTEMAGALRVGVPAITLIGMDAV